MLKTPAYSTYRSQPFVNKIAVFFTLLSVFALSIVNAPAASLATKPTLISGSSDLRLDKIPNTASTQNDAEDSKTCEISSSFTEEVQQWEPKICEWSKQHNLEPDLIATIMQIESCGNNNAVSSTGVRGLFQVTGANLDGQNPFDPSVSMAKGPGKVLKNELKLADGNIKAAFAGYNGGGKAREFIAGNVSRSQFYSYLRRHPSGYWRTDRKALAKINEVEWYAYWANIYFEAKVGKRNTLQKWLGMGGSRLCTSASASS